MQIKGVLINIERDTEHPDKINIGDRFIIEMTGYACKEGTYDGMFYGVDVDGIIRTSRIKSFNLDSTNGTKLTVIDEDTVYVFSVYDIDTRT